MYIIYIYREREIDGYRYRYIVQHVSNIVSPVQCICNDLEVASNVCRQPVNAQYQIIREVQ